ncbi:MAG: thiamine-phosphate kinase [Chitinivibrionales bacterium]
MPSKEYAILHSLKPYMNFSPGPHYPVGIGDDAVVRESAYGERVALTADVAVEEVHFSRRYMSLEEIGYKAMVSNISDCAAMGAQPDGALIQLVFPQETDSPEEQIKKVYRGFHAACTHWGFPIIGGDLARGPLWVLAITLLGRIAAQERILYRSGARPGDYIWVSGYPGQSRAGLEVLRRWGRRSHKSHTYDSLIASHIHPPARVALGRMLASDSRVHAAIDISDGVAKESRTIASESGLGIELTLKECHTSYQMRQLAHELQVNWYQWMLGGGEDYELLFAADPSFDPQILSLPAAVPCFRIGHCVKTGPNLIVRGCSGDIVDVDSGGWDHFGETEK